MDIADFLRLRKMERFLLGLTHGREQIGGKQKILIKIRITMRIFSLQ